jgi:hypothetical protein
MAHIIYNRTGKQHYQAVTYQQVYDKKGVNYKCKKLQHRPEKKVFFGFYEKKRIRGFNSWGFIVHRPIL